MGAAEGRFTDAAAYRLPERVRIPQIDWLTNAKDRSRLIVGLRWHGLDAWQAIQEDPELELKGKLVAAAKPAAGGAASAAVAAKASTERGKQTRALHRIIDSVIEVRPRVEAVEGCPEIGARLTRSTGR